MCRQRALVIFRLPFGWGGGLSREAFPGLRVFCDASHLYHKKHYVRNSRGSAPPPPACGYLTLSLWYICSKFIGLGGKLVCVSVFVKGGFLLRFLL